MFQITIANSKTEFCQKAAERIIKQILQKPDSVIGLSTGRTTGDIHRVLATLLKERNVDYSKVTFVAVDEVVGVDRDYSGACYKMIRTELLDSLGVNDDHFLIFPTRSENWDETFAIFTKQVAEKGGIDLLTLGLGENGHLGFNQPGTPFEKRNGLGDMYPELEERIRKETNMAATDFLGGATLGMVDIMHARQILLVANGKNKAEVVKRILTGSICTACPASILQLHPACEYLLDSESAALYSTKKL